MPGRCPAMPKSRHTSAYSKKHRPLLSALAVLATLALLAPAAALAAPEGPLPEPQPPQLAFEPGSHDFGIQPVNSNPAQATFTLRNVGAEPALVNLDMTGPGTESFWIGNSNCYGTTLQPEQSCFVQVFFGPHDAVEYDAQLRAAVGPFAFTANLTGVGGRAIFEPASNPTDFGSTAVGSAGVTREITVANVGNAPGGAFIAVIASGAIGSFQLLDENCTGVELAPAATCTLQVRFQPLSEGVKKAMLGLFGEGEGPTPIVLTGVGSAPEPAAAPASALAAPGPAARPQAKSHRRRTKIRRRPRRADLHVARRVLGADPR
jgi:hypothetical protein